ncbi:hypothetical protein [Rathayibacter sp. Leaf299]|uniref:hypothetical protein n=1 Tax=Rathayibacter sp. Leaf299 TaxID=1736328 RepID=UPI0012FA88DF|nr:hypothetical protein [Rathayibacter sp. Leaf299]
MSHHWTPMSMVSRSVTPREWRMADKHEHLGWIRLVRVDGVDTYVSVTRDEWVIGGGDTLPDAARVLFDYCAQKRPRPSLVE